MALSKVYQRRSGGSGSAGGRLHVSKKTTPKHEEQQQGGGRSSSNPPLTKTRVKGGTRSTGYTKRQSNGSQQRRANARGAAISASAAVSARGSSTNKPSGGKSKQSDAKLPQSNEERKKAVDEGAKVVEELRNDMVGVAQSVVDKAEAECEAMLAAALEGCNALTAGKEKDEEVDQIAMREIESKRAAAASRCSGMLREIETNRNTLSAMAKRFSAALDGVVQTESRKIKISLDRVTGEKS